MNKSILAIMAVLCTLFTACNKEALVSDSDYNLTIEKRSAESISVEYTTLEQNTAIVSCSKVEVNYYDDASATLLFVFDDNTTQEVQGTEMYVSTIPQNILDVIVGNSNFETSDISISVEGNALSYANSDESITGSGLSIIIEDDPEGL